MAAHREAKLALPSSLTLVGAGKMGSALLRGWLGAGLDPAGLTIVEPQPGPPLSQLCAEYRIALNRADARPAQVLVLAIKPQGLAEAAAELARHVGDETLLVSILAGKTIADLRGRLPSARAIVRAMPNLPASIGRGASGAVASPDVTAAQKSMAHALLACAGLVEWLEDEAQMDAVTALSGSGPAYVFLMAEVLAEAGVASGLSPETAARLARATVAGAGAFLDASPTDPAQLRRDVTSPGGTTAAALEVLSRPNGMPDLLRRAVEAARIRAGELSG